jgi:subtilisin family serine protease
MFVKIKVLLHDDLGHPARACVMVRYRLPDDSEDWTEEDTDHYGQASILLPAAAEILLLVAWSREIGFWGYQAVKVDPAAKYSFTRLPKLAEPAWWLRCMGIDVQNPDRGAGIKIGVIDGDLRPGAGLGHVATLGPNQNNLWIQEGWGHGEVVCRILADRDPDSRCLSVAPGSELVFVDASNASGRVDLAKAIAAIVELARDGVDLINLSWGHTTADQNTQEAIEVANELGVTVIAAGGNDPTVDKPYFPARSESCIGIGALGHGDWGPANSVVQAYNHFAVQEGDRLGQVPNFGSVYAWTDGTYGNGLDALAPGVGILFQRGGAVCYDVSGTSFAAPMATGLLAVVLSQSKDYLALGRTIERTNWVRRLFSTLCFDSRIAAKYQGQGVLRVR